MTLNKLSSEMRALQFDAEMPGDDHLLSSANRALHEIYARREITKTVRLFARGIQPIYYRKQIHCQGGSSVTLPLEGKSFSARVSGKGYYAITDGEALTILPFETTYETLVIKSLIGRGGNIRFFSDVSFTIYDFCVYPEVISPNPQDVPEGGDRITIDIRSLFGDFMTFLSSPVDTWGNIIPDCTLRDGKVDITTKYRGEIILTYRRLPNEISSDPESEIDIPKEYEHPFVLLTATYFLLDADSSKSSYYKKRFEEMFDRIEGTHYEKINNDYINVNGWA